MPIEHIWTSELEDGFDVGVFASRVLDSAMENLESDGFVQAAVFFVTSNQLHCYSVSFNGYEEKEATYDNVVIVAEDLKAEAIVTLNDAFIGDKYDSNTYVWGQAAKNPKGECIFVSVSGPGRENWTKEVEYRREDGQIVFSEAEIERKAFVGMLNGWGRKGQRAN